MLARAAAASGEPWRFHVVTRSLGRADRRLVEYRVETEGRRILMRRCSGSVCGGSYADGASVALFGYNEAPIRQARPEEPERLALRSIASYEFASPIFRTLGGRTVDRGSRSFEGEQVRAYEVEAPGTPTLIALLDARSALLRAVTRADRSVVLVFEDQRRVGPLMLPFALRHPDGSVERIESRAIEPAPLHPPPGPAVEFGVRRFTVPLSGRSDLPRFPCRLERIAAICLLDTGASGVSMGLDFADRLKKVPSGQFELEGLGPISTGVVRATGLELGNATFGELTYAVLPDAAGFEADIILGSDILARCVVKLDFVHRSIGFGPPGTPLEGVEVPLRFEGFSPIVATELGTLAVGLAIDTGDEASIDLPIALYREHPALFAAEGRSNVSGVGGRGTQITGRLRRMRLGDFTFHDVPIGATDIEFSRRPRLGARFLSGFAIDFDYANARLGLRAKR